MPPSSAYLAEHVHSCPTTATLGALAGRSVGPDKHPETVQSP